MTMYAWQDQPACFSVYTDSNWAGCKTSRKSTSGAVFLHGSHMLKAFSRTQANIALSSAEAELYATVMAASEGLGLKAMSLDFGLSLDPFLNVDASAAIGIVQRKGLGKLRHLDTQALWVQDAVRQRRVMIEKVAGAENPADLMTKHLDGPLMDKMLSKIGAETREGRADVAPEVVRANDGEEAAKAVSARAARAPTSTGAKQALPRPGVDGAKTGGRQGPNSWADITDLEMPE